ncbi:CPAMD8 [Branchiostoma lanceolatum]|uniref:CPAMD8 protein n=1 Tax=Branchiostoma lanceolatum TaxID=7740 RepID=A0A8K0EXP6_BRALA|nr:CPAMD8 [Branchiostoma lanceolatum]
MLGKLLLTAAVVLAAIHGSSAQVELLRVCEYQTMSISCPAGQQIDIVSALYGRTSAQFCNFAAGYSTDCRSTSSLAAVRTRCQGQPSCSVPVSNSVFGDPCDGTFKYLEVEFTCTGEEDVRDATNACKDRSTDTQYRYRWDLPKLTGNSFTFQVQANNDVHVALSPQAQHQSAMYEIVIGGWANTQSVIRRTPQGKHHATTSTRRVVSPTEYRAFWITWSSDGTIGVGRGGEAQPFMQWTDPDPLLIQYAGYTTGWGSSGLWRFCEACSADIVLTLDLSWSIPQNQFQLARDFMLEFIGCAALQGHGIRVGVILFNCSPWTYFDLGKYPLNSSGMQGAIHYMMYEGGETRTGVAIRYMKDTSKFRDGVRVPRAAVVFTDGQASDNYAYEAGEARAAGIDLYAVGVGFPPLIDQAGLQMITDHSDRVFDTTQACMAAQKIVDDLCG